MKKDLSSYFNHPDLILRSLENEDISKLVPIINDAYSYQNDAKGAQRTSIEHLTKRIAEVDFYTLTNGKDIIGCMYLEPQREALHFGLLTLIPEYRGKGIGDSLINATDNYAINNRYKFVALDYMSLAPWLKQYYENFGFSETGKITPWGKIDLIRMQKIL